MTDIRHKAFSIKERKVLELKDQTMPGGRFPIRNRQDLKNAIVAYGRANDKPLVRSWIIKRAKILGLTDILPEDWVEMEAKHDLFMSDFLKHSGVKGMKWGVRRSKRQLAVAAKRRTGKSVKDMSDEELRSVVNRMNMEQQFSRLSRGSGSNRNRSLSRAGAGFVGGIALNVARTQIQNTLTQRVSSAMSASSRDGTLIRTSRAVSAIGRTERR